MPTFQLMKERSNLMDEMKLRFVYQEHIRQKLKGHVKEYSDEKPFHPTFETLKLTPYWDEGEYNILASIADDPRDVDDILLDEYIHRLCTRSVMDVANGRSNCDTSTELFPELNDPDYFLSNIAGAHDPFSEYERFVRKKEKEKSGKKDKKKKDDKEKEKYVDPYTNIPDCVKQHNYKNTPLITMTLKQLRKCIFMECQHKLRRAHAHYAIQFEGHEQERISSILEVLKLKEVIYNMVKEQEKTEDYIKQFKVTCQSLETKMETSKEAKRRRRQAKKQRVRSGQAAFTESKSESKSEIGSGDTGARPADTTGASVSH